MEDGGGEKEEREQKKGKKTKKVKNIFFNTDLFVSLFSFRFFAFLFDLVFLDSLFFVGKEERMCGEWKIPEHEKKEREKLEKFVVEKPTKTGLTVCFSFLFFICFFFAIR